MGNKIIAKRELRILLVLIAGALVLLFGCINASGFEKEWYDLGYEDYQKAPNDYTTAQVKIKELKTYTGKTYKAIGIIDRYYTAIVDVTYAGGQTDTYCVSAGNHDKVGDTIEIAYDKRYDTSYDDMKRGEHGPADLYKSAARTEHIRNTRYSTVLIVIECVYTLLIAVFFIFSIKKAKNN